METLTPLTAWESVKKLKPVKLSGGPLDFDPLKLKELYKLSWLVSDAANHPALRLAPDPGLAWEEVEAEVHHTEFGLVVGHREEGGRWSALKDIGDLASLLGELPDGTEMELVAAGECEQGRMRFLGTVQDGSWKIESCCPKLDKTLLERALAFASSERLLMESEEQAERAVELASQLFDGTFMVAERQGRELFALMNGESDESVLDILRVYAFGVAFEGTVLHCRKVLERVTEEDEAMVKFANQLASMFQTPDPEGESLVFSGEFGRYFTAQLAAQSHMVPEDSEILDEEMKELGFQPLGDLSCNKVGNAVMRGYRGPHETFGIGLASNGGLFFVEFYTAFEDGWSLTTTNNPNAGDIVKKTIRRRSFPQLQPAELCKEHRAGCEELGKTPRRWENGLKGLAQAIDEYMQRQGLYF